MQTKKNFADLRIFIKKIISLQNFCNEKTEGFNAKYAKFKRKECKINNLWNYKYKKYMPQIFRYLKFIFSFLSNEHLPPHVHVSDENDNQSVFDLIIVDGTLVDIKVRRKIGYKPLSKKNQNIVKTFIYVYYSNIVTKWFEYFVLHKSIKPETIKKLEKLENLTVDTQKLENEMQDLKKIFYPTTKKQTKSKNKQNQKTNEFDKDNKAY